MIATKRTVVRIGKGLSPRRRRLRRRAAAQGYLFRAHLRHQIARSRHEYRALCLSGPRRGRRSDGGVERGFIEPQAELDLADIERQVAWYEGRGLVDRNVDARDILDRARQVTLSRGTTIFPHLPTPISPETMM